MGRKTVDEEIRECLLVAMGRDIETELDKENYNRARELYNLLGYSRLENIKALFTNKGSIEVFCGRNEVKWNHLYKRVRNILTKENKKFQKSFKVGPIKTVNIAPPYIKRKYEKLY